MNPLIKNATISPNGLYRLNLFRRWGHGDAVNLIMLNPSTADGQSDDPTIRACYPMAQRWGFGALIVTNLFPYRSSSADKLADAVKLSIATCQDADLYIRQAIQDAKQVWVGWGAYGSLYRERVAQVDHLIRHLGGLPKCIGIAANGHPKHPLLRFHTRKERAEASLHPWRMP